MSAGHLDQADLDLARSTGLEILIDIPAWLHALGDWRSYLPPPEWREPLPLPADWDA